MRFRILVLVFVFLAIPAIANAGGGYCAMAYSKSTGRCGDSYRCNSRAQAERWALSYCRANDAFIAGWGYNCHIALAVGHNGAWGFGSGQTKQQAERRALNNCPTADARILRTAWSHD